VSREAIVGDYELTAAVMPRVVERMRASALVADFADIRADLLTTSREAIDVVLDHVDAHPGWLSSHGLEAATLERLTARLVA
jgi:hypothetical protein